MSATLAQAQTPAITTGRIVDMVCFRDLGGNIHKLGEEVVARDGETVGWVSISQCSGGLTDGKLHVRLSGDFGDDMALVDPADVEPGDGRIVLRLTVADIIARFPRRISPSPSRP